MNRKRLIITSTISIILVAILMLGSTYSIFTSSDIDENANVYTTGVLNITYTLSNSNIKLEDTTPLSLEERYTIKPYRITVTNNGNVPYMFNLILNDTTAGTVINYQYIMVEVGQLEPNALSDVTDNIIKSDIILPANSSVNIDVRVWLSNTIQNTEVGKSFYGKLSIDGLAIYNNNDAIDNSILEAITDFYGEDYYYDNATSKYISAQNSAIQFTSTTSTYDYTGSSQTFTADHEGVYKLEAWGAQGGSSYYNIDSTGSLIAGGKGAYTSGMIKLTNKQNLYIYVGGQGTNGSAGKNATGGYNGGGSIISSNTCYQGAGGGGGATDFRLIDGNWDATSSLASRIMISAGGAGSSNYSNSVSGGYGGALIGGSGLLNSGSVSHTLAGGGTQIAGGTKATGGDSGDFGKAKTASSCHDSGGGSGYYGGGSGGWTDSGVSSGAGGSSYISGHTGCIAITSNTNLTPKVTTYSKIEDSYHYSGLKFTSTKMVAGNASMPTHAGTSTMTGNTGNGYAKITTIVPKVSTVGLTVKQGNILDVSSIKCVDGGAGCTIVQMYPRDTRSLTPGTYDLNILVKDNYNIVYKYITQFSVT